MVESLPKPISLGVDNKNATFNFSVGTQDNKITISASFDINSAIIQADQYDALKQFYKIMIDKQNEKIVLKKI
jgi:hypothetical protein